MLCSLPDMNSSFSGGWLFDYRIEEHLKDLPVISKRWVFRSARKINSSTAVEEKRKKLEAFILPDRR